MEVGVCVTRVVLGVRETDVAVAQYCAIPSTSLASVGFGVCKHEMHGTACRPPLLKTLQTHTRSVVAQLVIGSAQLQTDRHVPSPAEVVAVVALVNTAEVEIAAREEITNEKM